MKQSHLKTPRTTEECEFHSWGDPIHHEPIPSVAGWDALGFIVAALIFAGMIWVF